MVTGETARTKTLTTASGTPVTISVIRPAATVENVAELRRVSDRWDEEAGRLKDGPAQGHAYFAASVAYEGAARLAGNLDGRDACCLLVAQDQGGEVLGAVTYRPAGGVWELENMATAPRQQRNPLNRDPLRGIGTTMLGVVAQDVAGGACSVLELTALDADAERFWRGRGFHNTDRHALHLTCPEVRVLAEELSHSHPDRPDEGDLPFAVVLARWREIERPEVAAKLF